MSAIGQVEAFVAQGKIRNLLVAERAGQAEPVVERWIDDLIKSEPASFIGCRHMTDLPSPPLGQGDGQSVRLQLGIYVQSFIWQTDQSFIS